MNTKSIIYFGLSLVCLIIALIIFYTKFFTFLAFLFIITVVACVLLFRRGLSEWKIKKE